MTKILLILAAMISGCTSSGGADSGAPPTCDGGKCMCSGASCTCPAGTGCEIECFGACTISCTGPCVVHRAPRERPVRGAHEPAIIDQLLNGRKDAPATTLSTEETVTADLARRATICRSPINSKVSGSVELFRAVCATSASETLDRSVQYVPMIQEVFKAEGLPLDLAYVPIVESAFKNTALSRASAKGMWQFIQSTGFENGLQQNWFVDERSDPEKATHAAAQYLKSLAEEFDGDWNLALASYNAGPGRVEGAIKRSKTTDYWKMSSSTKTCRATRANMSR
jgi:hypothetical protein